MPRDIVVIGASAGGIEALSKVVQQLPKNLPAAVFITQHFPAGVESALPSILTRAGHMPAVHPKDGEPIHRGVIYIAPPGRHLILKSDHIELTSPPFAGGFHPGIDAMFESAAREFDGRVIGVILTGMLDDGVVGLLAIKASGGMAIVQDPSDSFSSSMPTKAIEKVAVDRVVPLRGVGQAIREMLGMAEDEGEDAKVDKGA